MEIVKTNTITKDGHLESKDLMIGDWVKLKEHKYTYKVENIFYNSIRIKNSPIEDCNDFPIDRFECIPITPEILKKNGWYFDDLDGDWYSNNKAPKLYGRDCNKLSLFDGSIIVGSVHELQHTLRLCGLTELADNFKV